MSEERQHHPFSPSKLQSLEVCSSYEGSDSDNEKARIGTILHNIVETGKDDSSVSDHDAALAAAAAEFYATTKKNFVGHDTGYIEYSEEYLPVDGEQISVDGGVPWDGTSGGYIDRALVMGKVALVVDFKFGAWAVEPAETNLQGIAYALGIFHRCPEVEHVGVIFYQPKLTPAVNKAAFKRSDIPALLLRVKTVVARAQAARRDGSFEEARATLPNCLFCANIGRCPAVAAFALKTGKKYSPVDVPDEITPTAVLTPEQSAVRLKLASLLEVWAGAVKKLESDRSLRTGAIPEGYELVSSSRRQIVDPKAFREVALRYLTADEYSDSLEIGLTKLEKAISAKAPRGSKTDTIERFQAEAEQAGATRQGATYAYLKVSGSETKTKTKEKE